MKKLRITFIVLIAIVLASCDKDIDQTTPEIDLSIEGAFPVNCDTLYFGEEFTFRAKFSDDVELGSTNAYSIDIHNNFDHHSHTTEVIECNLDPIKDPVNVYSTNETYDIPEGLQEYEAEFTFTLPSGDNDGDFDSGDYHFFISLCDHEGWTAQKGLSIKILHR